MEEKKIKDEKVISDLLESYHKDKKKIHIILKRITKSGNHEWMNGFAIRRPTENVWVIAEDKLGEVRIHTSEILDIELYEYETDLKNAKEIDEEGGE